MLQKTGGFALFWPLARAKIASDWRPVSLKLYLSGRQSHANCTPLAASRMHALAASCMKSRQFFASTLQEYLFDFRTPRLLPAAVSVCSWPSSLSATDT